MSLNKSEITNRAAGAVMGAFIGDALALGPHWYYDLEKLRDDYGDWIETYTDPKPGRYHDGLKAGQLSQAGYILSMTIQSLIENNGYSESDFCSRLDNQLFPLLDGTPVSGPGKYTSQSIREAWKKRVNEKLPWNQTGGNADTTEAIERIIAIAVRYAFKPEELALNITSNTVLTQNDEMVVSMTVAFGAVLGLLIQGNKLDRHISGKLMKLVYSGELPFHSVTNENLEPPEKGKEEMPRAGRFASPDALLTPSYIAGAALDPEIQIKPAWKVSIVYGMPCAIYHQIPSAYYLSALYSDDFRAAVLNAVNGGGQNQARAILTGALTGAQTGLRGIPKELIDGLDKSDELHRLALKLAEMTVQSI